MRTQRAARAASEAATSPSRTRADARLLVVDDEESNVLLLQRVLDGAGYRNVVLTTDPRRVDGMVDELKPDLLLLDLMMPFVDGHEILARIRRRWPDPIELPVVVLTADVTPEARRRTLDAGASDFLTKPFDAIEVVLRINNLLDAHLLHEALAENNAALERTVEERTGVLRRTIDDLRRVDANRRALLRGLVDAQETERRRIAENIHDDQIQAVTAVGLRLEILGRALSEPTELRALDELKRIVERAITSLRHLLFELRPPALDRDGLASALREYLRDVEEQTGLSVRIRTELRHEAPPGTREIAYRIAQEAITNVRKHARARSIDVALCDRDDGLAITIDDDGKGIQTRDGGDGRTHLGLASMSERAELAGGWCRVGLGPNGGTRVEAWLPVDGISGIARAARRDG